MKNHLRGTSLLLFVGLAACQPPNGHKTQAQWQQYSQPPSINASVSGQRHSIYFDTDVDRISDNEKRTMLTFVRGLNKSSSIRIRIGGHADLRGTNSYNMDLSLRRAENVARELNALGVHKLEIDVVGFGEEYPAAFGQNADSLARNRRVDLIAETVVLSLMGCSTADVNLSENYANVPDRQKGCSNLTNFISMIDDPRDLLGTDQSGVRDVGQADGVGQFGAVDRYRKREIPDLPQSGS